MAWQQPQQPQQPQGGWQQPQQHWAPMNGGAPNQPPQAPTQWQSREAASAPPQQGGWGGNQQPQPPQGQWGGQPSNYGNPQQFGGQQQWGGGQPGQWGAQQGMCGCCDQCCQQPGQQCCQCQQYGQPVDPYCCGPPIPEQQEMGFCCDVTCWSVGLFFILSLIGLAVVLGENSRDNIFKEFGATTTRELASAIEQYIPYQVQMAAQCSPTSTPTPTPSPNGTNATTAAPWTQPCTYRRLFGSFGHFCMEDSLNAGTFAANLSHWNNFRGTLYFLAFIITLAFMVVVYAVHRQKHPQGGFMNTSQTYNNASPNINLFGTELYEVFRCAWFVSGLIVFFWVANAMTSFWTFSKFYRNNTDGKLHDFWTAYDKKFVASVVCVTIYLCWPLLLIGVEIAVWFAFVVPYLAVRCMLKPGIETVRPDLPMSEMPGWVRADMFFTEAQQIRRLGFTHKLWEMVTGSKDAFCPSMDCCQMGFGGPMMQHSGMPPQWGQQGAPQGPNTSRTLQPQLVQPPRPGQMGDSEMNRSGAVASQPQQPAQPAATMSASFYPQESMAASAVVEVDGERKKEKKSKKDKHDKGTKEKKDKTGTKEKKEKKSKKDKHDSD